MSLQRCNVEDSLRALPLKYVILVALVLPILYYFLYFNPPNEVQTISDYEQQLVMLDGEIKKLDREIAEGDQIKVNLEIAKKEIKVLSSYFEAKPNAKTIEQIISDEARATGISFTSLQKIATDNTGGMQEGVSDGTVRVEDFISRGIIEASFTGTFIELMRFLSYLSRTDKIISLKQIELRAEGSERSANSSVKLGFKAEFETYDVIKDVNVENLAPAPLPTEEVAQ